MDAPGWPRAECARAPLLEVVICDSRGLFQGARCRSVRKTLRQTIRARVALGQREGLAYAHAYNEVRGRFEVIAVRWYRRSYVWRIGHRGNRGPYYAEAIVGVVVPFLGRFGQPANFPNPVG